MEHVLGLKGYFTPGWGHALNVGTGFLGSLPNGHAQNLTQVGFREEGSKCHVTIPEAKLE